MAPYQTVCNFLVYFFNPLGTHQSAAVPGGTAERILAKLVGHPAAEHARHDRVEAGRHAGRRGSEATPPQQSLHTQYGGPAIDSSGRADCQGGQTGYPNRLSEGATATTGPAATSSSTANTPGLAGGTFKSRQLGIDNLKDVP